MARPRKNLEVPGQENQQPKENATDAVLLNSVVQQPANTPEQLNDATAGATVITAGDDKSAIVQQRVAKLLDGAALEERNAILSGLNEQGAAVIARFEALEFLDADDRSLTDNLEFLTLVKKATDVTTGSAGPMVTNEEGKKQPAPGKPVLTEHGWHVPG
ncbi:hypothetical protein C0558_00940 [Serratia marcescens]|uniref:hypothetical protein n=1 Tax=Serratia TaxID=613 RepID=UPI00074539A5|nr:hypothetical protein [Serratia marcescens]AUO00420.1 hypothetical protein C0558_00940 [Serratia marcescens]MDW7736348.1 hypothetical protein [Serratia marcescens]CUY19958.1 Uncharacterised protein [Serratia marcescens]CUY39943.1 Uncharacterised protein [Serratia marcescens]CUY40015.1 Uncharacterised protein [Serratia marcescens]